MEASVTNTVAYKDAATKCLQVTSDVGYNDRLILGCNTQHWGISTVGDVSNQNHGVHLWVRDIGGIYSID